MAEEFREDREINRLIEVLTDLVEEIRLIRKFLVDQPVGFKIKESTTDGKDPHS